jgi:heme/copper-type cytochrome/quinol oxidase subunit 3
MSAAGATTPLRAGRVGRPPGWWGTVAFIATEGTLFATFVGTYFFLRFNTPHWPPPGEPKPRVDLPLLLAGILVATSVPLSLSARAALGGRRAAAWWALLVAFVLQCAYLGLAAHLFAQDVSKLDPRRDAYASIYETMVGADHAHVLAGLLLDLFLLARLAAKLTPRRVAALRVANLYWRFVIVATVVVALTQVSPSL